MRMQRTKQLAYQTDYLLEEDRLSSSFWGSQDLFEPETEELAREKWTSEGAGLGLSWSYVICNSGANGSSPARRTSTVR